MTELKKVGHRHLRYCHLGGPDAGSLAPSPLLNAIYIMSANAANAIVGFVFWIVVARGLFD